MLLFKFGVVFITLMLFFSLNFLVASAFSSLMGVTLRQSGLACGGFHVMALLFALAEHRRGRR